MLVINVAPDYAALLVTRRDFIILTYKIVNFKEILARPGGRRRSRLAGDCPERLMTACVENTNARIFDRQEEVGYASHF